MSIRTFFRSIRFAIDHAKQAEIDLAHFKSSLDELAKIYYVGKTAIRKDTGDKTKIVSAKFCKGKVFISSERYFSIIFPAYEPIDYYTITNESIEVKTVFDGMVKDLQKMKFSLDVSMSTSFINLEKRVKQLEDKQKPKKAPVKKRK